MEDKEAKIIDFDEKLVESYINSKRPPVEVRDQVDLGYTKENQAFELYEVRPIYGTNQMQKIPFARAKFVKSRGIWKVYWKRASGKWEPYDPPEVSHLSKFIDLVDLDEYGAFWG